MPNDARTRRDPDEVRLVTPTEAELHHAILRAHRDGTPGPLARLYGQAADLREAQGAVDAACFYLTQAYVHALDAGDPMADPLRARLKSHGREE